MKSLAAKPGPGILEITCMSGINIVRTFWSTAARTWIGAVNTFARDLNRK